MTAPSARDPDRGGLVVAWKSFYRSLVEQSSLDLVLRLTVVLHMVFPSTVWYVHIITVGLGACAMIHLPLLRNAYFWFFLGGFQLIQVLLFELATANNSSYVIAYWCLAIGCSLLMPDPRRALVLQTRLLVGLMFLFATVWKAATPEYVDGSTFYSLLLMDERFTEELRPMGEPYNALVQSRSALLNEMSQLKPVITIPRVPAAYWTAQAMTWWTLLIEGLVALLFLAPDRPGLLRVRNVVFLVFIVTTYPATKLTVFAWTLAIFGLAQCPPEFKKTRFCYLAAFVGVFLTLGGQLEDLIYDWLT